MGRGGGGRGDLVPLFGKGEGMSACEQTCVCQVMNESCVCKRFWCKGEVFREIDHLLSSTLSPWCLRLFDDIFFLNPTFNQGASRWDHQKKMQVDVIY